MIVTKQTPLGDLWDEGIISSRLYNALESLHCYCAIEKIKTLQDIIDIRNGPLWNFSTTRGNQLPGIGGNKRKEIEDLVARYGTLKDTIPKIKYKIGDKVLVDTTGEYEGKVLSSGEIISIKCFFFDQDTEKETIDIFYLVEIHEDNKKLLFKEAEIITQL